MTFLIINNGSTSLRFSIIDAINNITLAKGGIECIGTPDSYFKYENCNGTKVKINININNCVKALELINSYIFDSKIGVLNSEKEIKAVGHRVVHGGEKYKEAAIIDEIVLNDILRFSNIMPLHGTRTIESIIECQKAFKNIYNIAVFDTSFHSTIQKENYLYAIPKELYEKYEIRKYGFHGISYNYVLNRYSNIINKNLNSINTVICHLGGGSSICAIKNGKSFDTTMGYTPLSGLIMASRSGSIDPAIIPAIMQIYNLTATEALAMLNNSSGYFAICNDKSAKNIVEKSKLGDSDSILLRNMLNLDFKRNLLSMMANLDRIDSIIMTGGIGTKNPEQRELFLSNLEQFGISLDNEQNNRVFAEESLISSIDSKIPIYVIPTNEELEIANQCKKIMIKRL